MWHSYPLRDGIAHKNHNTFCNAEGLVKALVMDVENADQYVENTHEAHEHKSTPKYNIEKNNWMLF